MNNRLKILMVLACAGTGRIVGSDMGRLGLGSLGGSGLRLAAERPGNVITALAVLLGVGAVAAVLEGTGCLTGAKREKQNSIDPTGQDAVFSEENTPDSDNVEPSEEMRPGGGATPPYDVDAPSEIPAPEVVADPAVAQEAARTATMPPLEPAAMQAIEYDPVWQAQQMTDALEERAGPGMIPSKSKITPLSEALCAASAEAAEVAQSREQVERIGQSLYQAAALQRAHESTEKMHAIRNAQHLTEALGADGMKEMPENVFMSAGKLGGGFAKELALAQGRIEHQRAAEYEAAAEALHEAQLEDAYAYAASIRPPVVMSSTPATAVLPVGVAGGIQYQFSDTGATEKLARDLHVEPSAAMACLNDVVNSLSPEEFAGLGAMFRGMGALAASPETGEKLFAQGLMPENIGHAGSFRGPIRAALAPLLRRAKNTNSPVAQGAAAGVLGWLKRNSPKLVATAIAAGAAYAIYKYLAAHALEAPRSMLLAHKDEA